MSLVQRYPRKKGKLPRLAKELNWQRSLHQLSPCASARYGKGFGGDEDPRIRRDFQEALWTLMASNYTPSKILRAEMKCKLGVSDKPWETFREDFG